MKAEPTDLHAAVIFDEDNYIVPLIDERSIPGRVALAPDLMTVLINVGTAHGVTVGSMVRVMEPPTIVADPDDASKTITLQRNNGFYRADVVKLNFSLCSLVQITNRTVRIEAGDPCWVRPEDLGTQRPSQLVVPPSNQVM